MSQSKKLIEEMPSQVSQDNVSLMSSPVATPELFSNKSWAEVASGDAADVPQVPVALAFLEKNGVEFTRVPRYVRADENSVTKFKKELSVTFTVDTVVTSQEIILGFDGAGVEVDDITSIQRRTSNRSWVVSFRTSAVKQHVLELSHVNIAGCQVFIGDLEHSTVLVKIYEAPDDMPDTVLIGRLSHYGKVLSFRRDRVTSTIFNGIRTACMRLSSHIPSSVYIAGETVFFSYRPFWVFYEFYFGPHGRLHWLHCGCLSSLPCFYPFCL